MLDFGLEAHEALVLRTGHPLQHAAQEDVARVHDRGDPLAEVHQRPALSHAGRPTGMPRHALAQDARPLQEHGPGYFSTATAAGASSLSSTLSNSVKS